jgi:hypothetical protein
VLGVAALVALSDPAREVRQPSVAGSGATERSAARPPSRDPEWFAVRPAGGGCRQPGRLIADQESRRRSDLIDAIVAAAVELAGFLRDDHIELSGAVEDCRGEAAADAAAELMRGDLEATR